jgi:hypothetical protein
MAKAFRSCWNGNQNLVDEVTALHTREAFFSAWQSLEVEDNIDVWWSREGWRMSRWQAIRAQSGNDRS